jgi:hypothetical protein
MQQTSVTVRRCAPDKGGLNLGFIWKVSSSVLTLSQPWSTTKPSHVNAFDLDASRKKIASFTPHLGVQKRGHHYALLPRTDSDGLKIK